MSCRGLDKDQYHAGVYAKYPGLFKISYTIVIHKAQGHSTGYYSDPNIMILGVGICGPRVQESCSLAALLPQRNPLRPCRSWKDPLSRRSQPQCLGEVLLVHFQIFQN